MSRSHEYRGESVEDAEAISHNLWSLNMTSMAATMMNIATGVLAVHWR
jgi:hypothetical protein